MLKKHKTCLFLSMCLIFLFSGITISDEVDADNKDNIPDKAQIEKMLKQQPIIIFPWRIEEYSLKVISPNPDIDSKIVKNNYDQSVEYKLRIFNPFTKKEITGKKGPCVGSLQNNLQFLWTDKKYSMKIIRPNPDIDPEIVKNFINPYVNYNLMIIDPYTKKITKGYKAPTCGSLKEKYPPKGKIYLTPQTGPDK